MNKNDPTDKSGQTTSKKPPEKTGEGPRFSKKLQRYAQVGGGVGQVAMQLAGAKWLGMSLDQQKHSRALKEALGNIKGPLMKAAQILATIPEALPPDYAAELRELQSKAPPMGWPFVRRRMRGELGEDWEDRFAVFDKEAAAAASLGQVHKARSHDGDLLACKLQYPDMQSAVEADLAQLRIAFTLYRRYDKAIDTSAIFQELSSRLREELDYLREAANITLYQAMLKEEESVFVPKVFPQFSTGRLLTMNWLEGKPLLDFIADDQDQAMRNRVAMTMFRAWYIPFYKYGVIHGDPHLGNYSVRPDGSINLLDFGCIRVFRPTFVKAVIDLYHALLYEDDALAREAYKAWGFERVDADLLAILNRWARFIYGPLLEDKTLPIGQVASSRQGAQIAAEIHKALREVGGIKPPREFVLMDRAAIGLGAVFLHLRAEINWHQVFKGLIEDFDIGVLADRQKKFLADAGLPANAAEI